jgi:hypothetical protein
MLFCAVDTSASPVTSVLSTTVHVYVVPVGTTLPFDNEELPLGATVNAVPLQIAAGVCALTNGLGLTVTVVVNGVPGHKPDNGVTV